MTRDKSRIFAKGRWQKVIAKDRQLVLDLETQSQIATLTVACLAVKLETGELQGICFRLGQNGREHMRSATSIGPFLGQTVLDVNPHASIS